MFEMQSVLQGPVSPRRQMAAMAAFTHLAAATVLLVALAWRIESVEPPSFFAEALLPVAFLPAEWSAPLATPARTPAAAPAAKTPTVVQPDEVPDVVPTASSALCSRPKPSGALTTRADRRLPSVEISASTTTAP